MTEPSGQSPPRLPGAPPDQAGPQALTASPAAGRGAARRTAAHAQPHTEEVALGARKRRKNSAATRAGWQLAFLPPGVTQGWSGDARASAILVTWQNLETTIPRGGKKALYPPHSHPDSEKPRGAARLVLPRPHPEGPRLDPGPRTPPAFRPGWESQPTRWRCSCSGLPPRPAGPRAGPRPRTGLLSCGRRPEGGRGRPVPPGRRVHSSNHTKATEGPLWSAGLGHCLRSPSSCSGRSPGLRSTSCCSQGALPARGPPPPGVQLVERREGGPGAGPLWCLGPWAPSPLLCDAP